MGGPARRNDGSPEKDVVILRTDSREVAESWVREEPFAASGEVCGRVRIRPWSQVLPEPETGFLDRAISRARREDV